MESDKNITLDEIEAAKNVLAEAESRGIEIEPEEPRHYRSHRPSGHHSCLEFFSCFFLMIATVLACAIFLTVYISGPIIKTVEELPDDFPKDLVIYQLNQASIKVLSPESKEKIEQLSAALPDWAIQMIADRLYPDLKTQIIAQNRTPENIPDNPTVKDVKTTDGNVKKEIKTVSLSWDNINKTKEDLYEYYKKQLETKGFTVNGLVQSTEIDLSFFKNGIDGAMSLSDSFSTDGSSIIKMTVDYLNRQ
ncbi:MAG: hypothetical protein WC473_00095 [Patescibacteria group bacterium]|jgi:hypothetical protein